MGFINIFKGDPVRVHVNEYKLIPKIYIAGKLNDDSADKYILNLKRMIDHSEKVRKLNMAVFIPGIDFLSGLVCNWEYSDYFDNSQPWLLAADAVYLVPGWETSSGTKREIEYAKEVGIPVFDDIDKLKDHFNITTISNE